MPSETEDNDRVPSQSAHKSHNMHYLAVGLLKKISLSSSIRSIG